ncbi:hypothetical protein [Roseibium sp. ROS1]
MLKIMKQAVVFGCNPASLSATRLFSLDINVRFANDQSFGCFASNTFKSSFNRQRTLFVAKPRRAPLSVRLADDQWERLECNTNGMAYASYVKDGCSTSTGVHPNAAPFRTVLSWPSSPLHLLLKGKENSIQLVISQDNAFGRLPKTRLSK